LSLAINFRIGNFSAKTLSCFEYSAIIASASDSISSSVKVLISSVFSSTFMPVSFPISGEGTGKSWASLSERLNKNNPIKIIRTKLVK